MYKINYKKKKIKQLTDRGKVQPENEIHTWNKKKEKVPRIKKKLKTKIVNKLSQKHNVTRSSLTN